MPEDVEDVETRLSEYKDDKVSEAQSAAEDVRDAAESFFKEDSNGKAERAEAAVVDFKDGAGDLQQSAEEGIEHYAQMAEQSAEDVAQRIQDAASHAQSAFDDGLSVASDAVKSGAAQARFQYSRTQERAQVSISFACSITYDLDCLDRGWTSSLCQCQNIQFLDTDSIHRYITNITHCKKQIL